MQTTKLTLLKSLAIAAATLVAAWQSYSFVLVPNLRRSKPELVLRQNPADPVALSKRVLDRIKGSGQYVAVPEDKIFAVRSLIYTPLSRTSLRIIGFDHVRRQDTANALKLMAMSDKVSRRDAWAQIWLLEQAARMGDYDKILGHYHAALSVKPELAPALNPILVSVLRFPEIRNAVGPYLRRNAAWTPGFLAEASTNAAVADLYGAILPVAHHLSDEDYSASLSQIIYRLAVVGRFDDGMRLAAAAWDNFDAKEFEKFAPDESTADQRLGPLAWNLANDEGISSAQIRPGVFEATLTPLRRGVIASRSVPVAGGAIYVFTGRVELNGSLPPEQLRWQAECHNDSVVGGTEFWSEAIDVSRPVVAYRSTLSVPGECELLTLSLFGIGPDGQTETVVTVSDLDLRAGNTKR